MLSADPSWESIKRNLQNFLNPSNSSPPSTGHHAQEQQWQRSCALRHRKNYGNLYECHDSYPSAYDWFRLRSHFKWSGWKYDTDERHDIQTNGRILCYFKLSDDEGSHHRDNENDYKFVYYDMLLPVQWRSKVLLILWPTLQQRVACEWSYANFQRIGVYFETHSDSSFRHISRCWFSNTLNGFTFLWQLLDTNLRIPSTVISTEEGTHTIR